MLWFFGKKPVQQDELLNGQYAIGSDFFLGREAQKALRNPEKARKKLAKKLARQKTH